MKPLPHSHRCSPRSARSIQSGQLPQQWIGPRGGGHHPDAGVDDHQVLARGRSPGSDRVRRRPEGRRPARRCARRGRRVRPGTPWGAPVAVQHRGPKFSEHVVGVLSTQRGEPEGPVGDHVCQNAAGTDHHHRAEPIVLDRTDDHLDARRRHRLHQHRRSARTRAASSAKTRRSSASSGTPRRTPPISVLCRPPAASLTASG